MGFMPIRILPNPSDSEENAFRLLMKKNRFNKDLQAILSSSEDGSSPFEPITLSADPDQMRILGRAAKYR